ncbi:hypothetical protein [Anaerolentibacter hominis]|uniref:hypothetical protein n=1 Tax=Anaerolentibacter hominis TaxID=3079009 RepID=UPI0031B875CF
MFEQEYRLIAEKAVPEQDLIDRTIDKMQEERQKQSGYGRRMIRYAAAAMICLFLIAGAANLNSMGSKMPPLPQPEGMVPYGTGLPEKYTGPGTEKEEPEKQEAEKNVTEQKRPGIESDEVPAKKADVTVLTEKESYEREPYGNLLPSRFLRGYQFESASVYTEEIGELLSFSYTSGYDYISIFISPREPEDEPRMVKAEDTERYNISSYTIPFADSVPEEEHETMFYPIFQAEELTEEVLRLRQVRLEEKGEGHTEPRITMDFSLLCGDYVVRYNIKTKSTEGVYDMIASSEYYENMQKDNK